MTGRAEFSVYQFFPDDSYEEVLRFVEAGPRFQMAAQLSQSVGARIGTTVRIIITDGGDFTVFEWLYGEGITFPTWKCASMPVAPLNSA